MSIIKVLYVDDENNNLISFKATFRNQFEVITCISPKEAFKVLKKENEISVILIDQRMPGTTGVEFMKDLKENFPEPLRILITAYADVEVLEKAINDGNVYKYICKPWNENMIEKHILEANILWSARRDTLNLAKSLIEKNDRLDELLRVRFNSQPQRQF